MKWNDPIRQSQLKLQDEERKNKPRKPWRDNLYGRLKGKVSVRVMDIMIWSVVGLIFVAIIVGMAMGN